MDPYFVVENEGVVLRVMDTSSRRSGTVRVELNDKAICLKASEAFELAKMILGRVCGLALEGNIQVEPDPTSEVFVSSEDVMKMWGVIEGLSKAGYECEGMTLTPEIVIRGIRKWGSGE